MSGKEDIVPEMFSGLRLQDLQTMVPHRLEAIQNHISAAVVGKEYGDPRWIQLYVSLLLRGVDVMKHAVFENAKAREMVERWAHRTQETILNKQRE